MSFEWVEILEPESKRKLYVSVDSGECQWEQPSTPFKPHHANQWWELADARSNRKYYYNVETQATVWERPEGADIVELEKLQTVQEQLAQEEDDQSPSDGALNGSNDPHHDQEKEDPQGFPEEEGFGFGSNRNSVSHVQDDAFEEPVKSSSVEPVPTPTPPPPSVPVVKNTPSEDSTPIVAAPPKPAPPKPAARPTPPQTPSTPVTSPTTSSLPASSPQSIPQAPPIKAVPPAPPAKPSITKKESASSDLSEFKDNLTTHKKGLFRRKVSIHSMLSWQKDVIPIPMLLTHNKKNKKDAVEMFKLVQTYMGDRKGKDINSASHEIIAQCWSTPPLRDELFIQLCKQTTANPFIPSCERGWELFSIALNFFPPSSKFSSYLEGYIWRHTGDGDTVSKYAEYCLKRLDRVLQSGTRRGQQQPTPDEIDAARRGVFQPSVFGSTLEEIMEVQQKTHPELEIPWVLVKLPEVILHHKGAQTEGIFRVPGDIDAVNALKVCIDRGEIPSTISDPHVPGSALKLWFRELYEPVIPGELYDACMNACNNAVASKAVLDQLKPLNRKVLLYIIRFIQLIGRPENNAATKMNYDNLSMVWAPNFLRCPSEDPMVIFQNTKREMSFLRNLVLEVSTDEVAHLGLK